MARRNPMEEIINQLINNGAGSHSDHADGDDCNCGDTEKDFKLGISQNEQREILQEFVDQKALKVGDIVERNQHGKKRYKFPIDGNAAMVTQVFAAPMLDERSCLTNGEVTILVKGPRGIRVASLLVDLRLYSKIK